MPIDECKIVQVSSHVTSLAGWVGIVGLCSCGWLGSGEDANTKLALSNFMDGWEKEHAAGAPLTGLG
jgi:hypothetical protein